MNFLTSKAKRVLLPIHSRTFSDNIFYHQELGGLYTGFPTSEGNLQLNLLSCPNNSTLQVNNTKEEGNCHLGGHFCKEKEGTEDSSVHKSSLTEK